MNLMTILLLCVGFVIFSLIMIIVIFVMIKKSYKNKVIIFRRTGKQGKDVIIFEDRFRVAFKEGMWVIHFYKLKEKTKSIGGQYWLRFLSAKGKKEVLKYTQDEWDRLDLSDKVQRGLLLYETREGNYHPITLDVDDEKASLAPDFSQDDRAFQARQTEEAALLTRNKRTEKLVLLAIIIGIIAIVIIGGALFYFMQKNGQANIQQSALVCGKYAEQILNVTVNGQPQFIKNIIPPVVGG